MSYLKEQVHQVTQRIQQRSERSRAQFLRRIERQTLHRTHRSQLSMTNLAHSAAAEETYAKQLLLEVVPTPNIAIVTAYNDMLSAHQPYQRFPALIKQAARERGCTAQVAGGVPAMCDGITQGMPGMELSLFSRDIIALSTAIALSHHVFDGVLCLGICDKIVPGLFIGAMSFGHLPVIFVPSGPMPTGLSNDEKAKIREWYAQGKVDKQQLLASETQSYHSPGTCTFYGTANTNQMLLEIMGLVIPGSAFFHPQDIIRDPLTIAATHRVTKITALGDTFLPFGKVVDERTIVNAIVGLLATGGSTNHTIHLIAMAQAAGIRINWGDFHDLSNVVPLLCKIYPNSHTADINHFHAAGGTAYLIGELLRGGLLHADVQTVMGHGLTAYTQRPVLVDGRLVWQTCTESKDKTVITTLEHPFSPTGGLKVLTGNLGRAIIKVSAVPQDHWLIEAPAIVFHSQQELLSAFQAGQLEKDFVAVVKFQGPRANGMPELHKLVPSLSVLQDKGFKVALVTDGRMSGASGKVPAAIHVTPECMADGPLLKVQDGDVIRLDMAAGTLDVLIDIQELTEREIKPVRLPSSMGTGRELFATHRAAAASAEQGAVTFFGLQPDNQVMVEGVMLEEETPHCNNGHTEVESF